MKSRLWFWLGLSAASAPLLLIMVLFILASQSYFPEGIIAFIKTADWNPITETFGAFPFIWGTLLTALTALCFSFPVALGTALFLRKLRGAFRETLYFVITLLAAIPSVVYGLWGVFYLAPIVDSWAVSLGYPSTGGFTIMTASIILGIMVLPILISVFNEVFRAVPNEYQEALLGLGAQDYQVDSRVVLPTATPGIIAGVILALGRALGETLAVTMVVGNKPLLGFDLFAPGYTLASVIANEFPDAQSQSHVGALVGLGLVLILMSLLVNLGARLISYWMLSRRPAL